MAEEKRFLTYGWLGLAIMLVAEALLLLDNAFIKQWFTPIMWSGYILFVDALIFKLKGSSLIKDRTRQFLFMLPFSIGCWVIFEAYNLHLQNWQYVGLPEDTFQRYLGYAWAFATIWPGVLLTYEVVHHRNFFSSIKLPTFQFRRSVLMVILVIGLAFLVGPIFVPQEIAAYLFGPVWIGFVFFLDPFTYFIGGKSLFGELENGRIDKVLSLFLAGAICGLLWEFWNYWATAKWLYTVPFLQEPKIFEMPLFGFLGFLPFAVEVYVMWQFAVRVLKFEPSF